MELVDFTPAQLIDRLVTAAQPSFDTFLQEYVRCFWDKPDWSPRMAQALAETDAETTEHNVSRLARQVADLEPSLAIALPLDPLPVIAFFVGPGTVDAHGLLIEGRPWVFFDMTLLNVLLGSSIEANGASYRMDVHVAHEVVHGLHYARRPEFYPGRYDGMLQRRFYHRMWAEGVSTCLSQQLTHCSSRDALVLGLLSEPEFLAWKGRCDSQRSRVRLELARCLAGESDYTPLWRSLFLARGGIQHGRLGYWYGFECARQMLIDRSARSLLEIAPEQAIAALDKTLGGAGE